MLSKASVGYGEDAIKTFRNLLGNEAKAKLDAILADPQKESFWKNLYGVFTKGTSADVMARIYAAVNLLQREDSALLGSAVAALRNAPDDEQLIAAQPNAAEEFAAIDRKADKIELTPWGVLKLFKEVIFGDD